MEVFTTVGGDAWSTGWRDAHGHALAANAVQLQFEALQEIAAWEAGQSRHGNGRTLAKVLFSFTDLSTCQREAWDATQKLMCVAC